ncbi:hypothetical protein BDA99DRAFT_519934 [Phascolomyces articulosus]|uniref:Uncharacterized protein n=1 Tax=Phascolomyces articulosus TaxID=60185 RepID=A0AAD5PAX2_9FUNG|nr:hypothetical protein BDA99DRAFT_519934 [Phascolomyces articulosus]
MNTEATLANTRLCKKCKCYCAIEMFAVPEEWLISFDEALSLLPSRYDDDENNNTAHGERAFIEYTLDVYIHLDDELLELDEEFILARIPLKFARSFCCRCSQDYDVQRQVFNVDRRRLDSRMETYFCGGHIQGLIDKRNRYAHINVEHSTGHPTLSVPTMYQVNEEIRIHILQNCIKMDAHALLTQPQVYYWWNGSFETQYKLANNQYGSARLLIERALPHGVDKVS